MKKLLGILVLGLILFSESVNAKKTKMVTGKDYEGEIIWVKGSKIKLPPGKFRLIERFQWSSWGISAKSSWFANFKEGVWDKHVELGQIGSVKYLSQLRQIYYEILFMDQYDGCYPRSEYTVVKVKRKGAFINCFKVQHIDINKELYFPDDPQDNHLAYFKWYIKKNNLTVPAIAVCSVHYFYAPTVTELLLIKEYCVNPETDGGLKNKFTTEESSEYHPSNINQYPDKKKYMEEFIKLAAQRHKSFEIGIGAKERHKLDLSEYGVTGAIEKTKATISSSSITDQLEKLSNLYKEGVITKEEFEKAKKKLLN